MTIKTEDELLADFADGKLRGVDGVAAVSIRDFIDSLGVGGTLYGTSVDPDDPLNRINMNLVTGWQPFEWFTNSIDTKGLNEDLSQGHFTLGAGTDGNIKVGATLGVTSDIDGWVEIAITKNGALTPYRMRRTLTAGGTGCFSVLGSGQAAAGDTVGLAIRPSGSPPADTVALMAGQFRVFR